MYVQMQIRKNDWDFYRSLFTDPSILLRYNQTTAQISKYRLVTALPVMEVPEPQLGVKQ